MVSGAKSRVMVKVDCSPSSLIQIKLQEADVISSAPWTCVLFLRRACQGKLGFSLWLAVELEPRTYTFTTMMGENSLTHFTHPTSLQGKGQTGSRGRPRTRCRKGGPPLSPRSVSIPAWFRPFCIYHTTPHFVRKQWIVDIFIFGLWLVLFPLLGMPFYTAQLFQDPEQRLAPLGIFAPLIF